CEAARETVIADGDIAARKAVRDRSAILSDEAGRVVCARDVAEGEAARYRAAVVAGESGYVGFGILSGSGDIAASDGTGDRAGVIADEAAGISAAGHVADRNRRGDRRPEAVEADEPAGE